VCLSKLNFCLRDGHNGGRKCEYSNHGIVLKREIGWRRQRPWTKRLSGQPAPIGQDCEGKPRIRLGLPSPRGQKRLSITMATKRNYKKDYQLQKQRGDVEGFLERQKARRLYDKKGIDRAGKDIDHIKPIRKGGKTTVGNLRLRDKSKNKSDNK